MKKKNKHQQNAQQVNNHDHIAEQPEFVIMIPVFKDGRVGVSNFPTNWPMERIMQVLAAAMIVIAQHFRKESDEKNLSRIIQLNQQQAAMIAKKVKEKG